MSPTKCDIDAINQIIKPLLGHTAWNVRLGVGSFITMETKFIFDHSFVLHTFPLNFIDPYEHWMLFTPDGKVLVLGPALQWSFELSSEINHQQ